MKDQQTPKAQTVCAVVVTYNRKAMLRGCLDVLQKQTRPVDHILVVDNASTDGTPDLVRAEFPGVELLELPDNVGGSGGFHAGVKAAYEAGYDWLWCMDDDAHPQLDCLENLMEKAAPKSVIIPVQQGREGPHGILGWQRGGWVDCDPATLHPFNGSIKGMEHPTNELLFTFVGPLISRQIVDRVGLPRPDYFIWFDDFEYAFRIRRLMKPRFVVVPDAKINHDPGFQQREVRMLGLGKPKMRGTFAVWRAYYMSRNSIYTLTRTRRRWREVILLLLAQVRILGAVLLYDPDRWPRAGMQLKGIRDGLLGRMGRRH